MRVIIKYIPFCAAILWASVFLFSDAFVLRSFSAEGSAHGQAVSGSPLPVEEEEQKDFSDLLSAGAPASQTTAEEKEILWGIKVEGKVRQSLWYQTHSPERFRSSIRIDAELERSVGPLRMQAAVRSGFQNLEEEGGAGVDLREAFAEYLVPLGRGVRVSAGKRIVNWGKGDEIRPLDRVCPEDMTEYLFYDKLDRKTGILGLFSDISLAEKTRLELFWSPFFQRSKTGAPGDYFEPVALRQFADRGGTIRSDEDADSWKKEAGAGARFSFSLLETDLSFYGYRGMDPNPTYRVSRFVTRIPVPAPFYWFSVPPTPVEIEPFHPVVSMVGMDLERVAGPFVIRAELAYMPEGMRSRVRWKDDPSLLLRFPEGVVEKDRIQYLAGFDKADFIIPRLILNLQYVGEHTINHEDYLFEREFTHAVTLTLKYSFLDSRLEAMWRGMVNLSEKEHYTHVEVSWKPMDMAQLTLGGMFFAGDREDYLFGQYDAKDFIFTRLKLLF